MNRFNFRLNPLLMLREMQESEAARALRDALASQQRLEVALSVAQSFTEAARVNLDKTEGSRMGAVDFAGALADFDRKLAAECCAKEDVRKQSERVAAARRVWEQAVTELKTVGKLREKAARLHRKEEARREQLQLDEVGARFAGTSMSTQL